MIKKNGSSRQAVLVLDAHSRAGVESTQALGKFGVEVHAASDSPQCLAFHSRYTRRAHLHRKSLPVEQVAEWITELDNRFGYRLIVPSTEYALLAIRSLPESSPIRLKSVVPSNRSLDTALEKQQTLQFARRLGVSVPRSTFIENESDVARSVAAFPLVLKPNRSVTLRNGEVEVCSPVIVTSEVERRRYVDVLLANGGVQQQEYIKGTGIGVDLLFNRGLEVWHFAHRRLHEYPLTGGGSTYRCSVSPPKELLKTANALLSALEWHGVAMVEFKMRQDGTFVLMEINPRLFGSLALAIDAGVNFPYGLLQLANGGPVPPQPPYKVPYYTRHLPDDIQWQVANLKANHKNRMFLTKSRSRSFLEMFRPILGSESWDHFDLADLMVTAVMLKAICDLYSRSIARLLSPPWRKLSILLHHRRLIRHLGMQAESPGKLLFLCHGNICRSPFAAALAQRILPGITIESAGAYSISDRPCDPAIIAEARLAGIDLSRFGSRTVSEQQLRDADLILVMDTKNYDWVRQRHPEALAHTTMLGLFASAPSINIDDPYGKPLPEVAKTCKKIASAVEGVAMAIRQRFSLAEKANATKV